MAADATNLSPLPVTCEDCGDECERTSNRQRTCIPCRKSRAVERERQRKLRDPDRYQAQQKAHRTRHSEKYRAQHRERYYREKADDRQAYLARARKRGSAYRQRKRQERLDAGWTPRKAMGPEERRARRRATARVRYQADPLSGRMTAAIRRALKGRKQRRPWTQLVGYSAADLRTHIERQFVKGMGWHNMDEWHIDHIIPLSQFNYVSTDDPDFHAAWALTNLRPLWAHDNQTKYAKRTLLL